MRRRRYERRRRRYDRRRRLPYPVCVAGQYRDGYSCKACPSGQYQTDVSQLACLPCDSCAAGSARDNCGAYSPGVCTTCPAGKYKHSFGTWDAACTDCELGKYNPYEGNDSCYDCPAGKYARSAHSTCSACTSGRYSDHTGASDCYMCVMGKHQGAAGQTLCAFCPKGKYQHLIGKHKCYECAAGTYQPDIGKTACPTCPYCTTSDLPEPTSCYSLKRDCVLSEWSGWGACSNTCAEGVSTRTRSAVVAPRCGGLGCASVSEELDCLDKPCPCKAVTCKYHKHNCTTHYLDSGAFDPEGAAPWHTAAAGPVAAAPVNSHFCATKQSHALDSRYCCNPEHTDKGIAEHANCTEATHNGADMLPGLDVGWLANDHRREGTCVNAQSIQTFHSKAERRFQCPSCSGTKPPKFQISNPAFSGGHWHHEGHHCKLIGGAAGSCACRCHKTFRHAYNPAVASRFDEMCGPLTATPCAF